MQLGVAILAGQIAPFGVDEPGLFQPLAELLDMTQRMTVGEYCLVEIAQPAGCRFTSLQAEPMGQAQLASPIQSGGNGGQRITPQLVDSYIDNDGHVTHPKAPDTRQVVTPETAKQVVEMMEEVVSKNGTAPMAAIPGYRIAGKTGTANRIDDSCGCYKGYTASFIGLAPADDPQVVAAVILQDPQNGHYGGALGAPVFKEVMTAALQTLRIPPPGSPPADLPINAG